MTDRYRVIENAMGNYMVQRWGFLPFSFGWLTHVEYGSPFIFKTEKEATDAAKRLVSGERVVWTPENYQ